MISETGFISTAKILNVEPAVIKAVAEVESRGEGFLNDKPLILFEPHIFWKQLKTAGLNPADHVKGNEDILYQKWRPKTYGPISKQHERMERAAKINRTAALLSASWGRFQIMGFNWKQCGCDNLQEFINAMYKSEDEHLRLFCNYIQCCSLDTPLRNKNWAMFAKRYNGSGYLSNKYDTKLQAAYEKYRN